MAQWFDLHLYLANWGSRRLMIRLPRRLIEQSLLDGLLPDHDCVEAKMAGDNLILDISRNELELDDEGDGEGTLARWHRCAPRCSPATRGCSICSG